MSYALDIGGRLYRTDEKPEIGLNRAGQFCVGGFVISYGLARELFDDSRADWSEGAFRAMCALVLKGEGQGGA